MSHSVRFSKMRESFVHEVKGFPLSTAEQQLKEKLDQPRADHEKGFFSGIKTPSHLVFKLKKLVTRSAPTREKQIEKRLKEIDKEITKEISELTRLEKKINITNKTKTSKNIKMQGEIHKKGMKISTKNPFANSKEYRAHNKLFSRVKEDLGTAVESTIDPLEKRKLSTTNKKLDLMQERQTLTEELNRLKKSAE